MPALMCANMGGGVLDRPAWAEASNDSGVEYLRALFLTVRQRDVKAFANRKTEEPGWSDADDVVQVSVHPQWNSTPEIAAAELPLPVRMADHRR